MMRHFTPRHVHFFSVVSFIAFSILGWASYSYAPQKAAPSSNFYEDFDGVAPPFELPSGWTSFGYQTSASGPAHTPNNVVMGFTGNNYNVVKYLTSPPITLGQISPKLVFHHNIQLSQIVENGDGCVLDIKIGDGEWTDIVAAGGTFLENGYTGTVDAP